MADGGMRRRDFVGSGALAAGALAFGPSFWRRAFSAEAATAGPGPYGPLLAPDANGIMLPAGFKAREIARGLQPVPGTAYSWHVYSDGQATYAAQDGGWILVSNSESLAANRAGSSAIRFAPDGEIASAYRILAGTNLNCAGGRTPWGTWLSCEEYEGGQVWESDPTGATLAVVRPAMGQFKHEAAGVDPVGKRVYLTEDDPAGGFYRFTPTEYPKLDAGLLEVAVVGSGGAVTWKEVEDPSAIPTPTRQQVPEMTQFKGGEGIWFDKGTIYFTTKGDNKVWAYDTVAARIETIYELAATPDGPLSGVDNVTVSAAGDVYVCEDGGNLELCLITPERVVAPFLRVTGEQHENVPGPSGPQGPSELAGVIFDPSGTRLYFSSQRGYTSGVIYEVSGPFRLPADPGPNPSAAPVAGPVPDSGPSGGGGGGDGDGGGQPGEPDADRDAPGVKLTCRRRISLARVMGRGGLRVSVRVDEPGELRIALRTPDLKREPGQRGSSERPVQVTLGTLRRRIDRPGHYKLTVRISRRMARRLGRKRSVGVRVTAQVRDRAGNVGVANRRLRIER
jgi:secreted PhoX family phosphatase